MASFPQCLTMVGLQVLAILYRFLGKRDFAQYYSDGDNTPTSQGRPSPVKLQLPSEESAPAWQFGVRKQIRNLTCQENTEVLIMNSILPEAMANLIANDLCEAGIARASFDSLENFMSACRPRSNPVDRRYFADSRKPSACQQSLLDTFAFRWTSSRRRCMVLHSTR